MELTEERVREIVREIVREEVAERVREAVKKVAEGVRGMLFEDTPPGMTRLEAGNLRDMGLDPFEEAEKPKPCWMTYSEAAELRAGGTDPFDVTLDSIRGTFGA